jgi:AcrR family transcriptional regulator
MADVAAEAKMSRQALYLHFSSRTSLMLALVEHVGRELGARELFGGALAAPTPRKVLEESLRASARFEARVHEVVNALDVARHTDDAAAAAWQDRMALKRQGIRRVVRRLHRAGMLDPSWKVADAVDAIAAIGSPASYASLVLERGWSLAKYERYLVETVSIFLRR